METALKQRLLGAAVLVALAVTFLPLLVMERAPDSGASDVSLRVPAAPDGAGDTRTIDLPLAAPATGRPILDTPVGAVDEPPTAAPGAPVATTAATAGGDYAVNFGSYASTADAARVIAALAAARLPAYQEPAAHGARTVHRVRVGPYATAADAEAARLAASRVRSDVNARVVVLDADVAPARAPAAAAPAAPAVATISAPTRPTPAPATPAADPPKPPAATAATPTTAPTATPATTATPPPATAPSTGAASVGFAVQLGAFANAAEATRLRDRARAAGFSAFVEQVPTDGGSLNRVRVGPVADRSAADALRTQVAGKLGVSGIVRQHP